MFWKRRVVGNLRNFLVFWREMGFCTFFLEEIIGTNTGGVKDKSREGLGERNWNRFCSGRRKPTFVLQKKHVLTVFVSVLEERSSALLQIQVQVRARLISPIAFCLFGSEGPHLVYYEVEQNKWITKTPSFVAILFSEKTCFHSKPVANPVLRDVQCEARLILGKGKPFPLKNRPKFLPSPEKHLKFQGLVGFFIPPKRVFLKKKTKRQDSVLDRIWDDTPLTRLPPCSWFVLSPSITIGRFYRF